MFGRRCTCLAKALTFSFFAFFFLGSFADSHSSSRRASSSRWSQAFCRASSRSSNNLMLRLPEFPDLPWRRSSLLPVIILTRGGLHFWIEQNIRSCTCFWVGMKLRSPKRTTCLVTISKQVAMMLRSTGGRMRLRYLNLIKLFSAGEHRIYALPRRGKQLVLQYTCKHESALHCNRKAQARTPEFGDPCTVQLHSTLHGSLCKKACHACLQNMCMCILL